MTALRTPAKVLTYATLACFVSLLTGNVALAAGGEMRHPVNCATAEGDLRAIAAEKKHAEEKQAESVIAITPAGALLGLIAGNEQKKLQMLSGVYIQNLNERADQIKTSCGLK